MECSQIRAGLQGCLWESGTQAEWGWGAFALNSDSLFLLSPRKYFSLKMFPSSHLQTRLHRAFIHTNVSHLFRKKLLYKFLQVFPATPGDILPLFNQGNSGTAGGLALAKVNSKLGDVPVYGPRIPGVNCS